MFVVDSGIYGLAFIASIFLLRYIAKVEARDKNKLDELNDIIRRRKRGETLYVEDLKYLTKEDLKRHLKNVRFIDEK
ncbi:MULTISPECIES: hypothetical protein [unclassified Campylobacter]|uniref:hypothetical protein n=1 Tax=unclassified Campylobacter TaxID=2593542 RepID=UPI001473850B|nr:MULTISPECIES: hypothetical protein [unclassified Campylobacter]